MPSLLKSTIEKVKVKLTLLKEQKIADCLSSMDQSIKKPNKTNNPI